MITLPKVKLEKVCSINQDRPILENPYLLANKSINKDGLVDETPEYGTLVATNGFALAVLPVEHDDTDTSGPIPNAAIKQALKDAKKKPARLDLATVERVPCERLFPKVEQIIGMRHTENLVSISIDAELLFNLADALCERKSIRSKPLHYVRLTFSTSTSPVLVEPIDRNSTGFGMLMPIHDRK